MTITSGELTMAVVGSVLGSLVIALIAYLACRKRGASERQEDPLIDEDARLNTYGGADRKSSTLRNPSAASAPPSAPPEPWTFGELSKSGLERVRAWIDAVKAASDDLDELEPAVVSIIAESLLGDEDPGSPPNVYSPRVSNVGSDDVGRSPDDRNSRENAAVRSSSNPRFRDPLAS